MATYCELLHATTQAVLIPRLRVADNPWLRFWGLMGKDDLAENEGLWIKPCNQVHSCFMKFQFDAVFLDKTLTIQGISSEIPPWRLSPWVRKANSVIELRAQKAHQLGLSVGDSLIIRTIS